MDRARPATAARALNAANFRQRCDAARSSSTCEFSAPSPGVTALFGRSGSGKSTRRGGTRRAARRRARSVRSRRPGVIRFAAGVQVPAEERAIACVFQDARLFPHLDVLGNLHYGLRRVRGRAAPISEREIVELLGLGHRSWRAACTSCPAARNNACRSAVPCWRNRACCCSMSRSPRSMRRGGRKCCRTWSGCATRCASRSCT